MAGVDGSAPGGEGRRKHGGMIVGDPAGDGCRGCKERVGGEREDDRLWSRGGRRRKVEAPELGRGRASAGEDGVAVWEMNGDIGVGEGCSAAVVTEDSNRDEGTRSKGWKDVRLAGGKGKAGDGKFGGVGGGDGAAVGKQDGDARCGSNEVGVGCLNGEVVTGATGVEDHRGRQRGGIVGRGPGEWGWRGGEQAWSCSRRVVATTRNGCC